MEKSDVIVDIPEHRQKFFGGPGKMLLPCPATVATMIGKVPASKLVTTDLLCRKLAQQFKVKGACPVTTKKAIQAIADDPAATVGYWRVVNADGGLMARFPGGAAGQAERLRKEGLTIEAKGKALKVTNYRENLARF